MYLVDLSDINGGFNPGTQPAVLTPERDYKNRDIRIDQKEIALVWER